METSNSLHNVLSNLTLMVVVIAAVIYFAHRRSPRFAHFHLFTKRSFAAFMVADALMYGMPYLAKHQLALGSSTQMLVIMAAGAAICVAMAVCNVRKTRPVFGLAATVLQVAFYSVAFPLLLAWFGYRVGSMLFANGTPHFGSEEERERFEISDDEMLKVNLYSPERMNPGVEERGY